MTEDLFVDGYVAASLLTNNRSHDKLYDSYGSSVMSPRAGRDGIIWYWSLEILPTFAIDYSVVSSQEAAFEVTSGAGNSNELSSPGNVRQLSLTFLQILERHLTTMMAIGPRDQHFGQTKGDCQRIDQDTIIEECGQGATVSVVSQDESQMKTLSFTLGINTISNDTTYSANALYKVEF